ncbi:MAG TPA: TadE family protein [Bacillota bacterium]|nr:TadE family protein [Bacillota bacterium]
MKRKMSGRLLSAQGSYTVEAAIIFPAILLLIFGVMALSMYVYQRYAILEAAVYTSAQRAATWDNSSKQLETGIIDPQGAGDGLYWRLLEDYNSSPLASRKRQQAAVLLNSRLYPGIFSIGNLRSAVSLENTLMLNRGVVVDINQVNFRTAELLRPLVPEMLTVRVRSAVSEPVEYIRNIDFLKSLGNGRMVVSSINSDIYHYPECPRRYDDRIKDKNFTTYMTEEQALQAGKKRACRYCQKL